MDVVTVLKLLSEKGYIEESTIENILKDEDFHGKKKKNALISLIQQNVMQDYGMKDMEIYNVVEVSLMESAFVKVI
jgi:hypothetical protein